MSDNPYSFELELKDKKTGKSDIRKYDVDLSLLTEGEKVLESLATASTEDDRLRKVPGSFPIEETEDLKPFADILTRQLASWEFPYGVKAVPDGFPCLNEVKSSKEPDRYKRFMVDTLSRLARRVHSSKSVICTVYTDKVADQDNTTDQDGGRSDCSGTGEDISEGWVLFTGDVGDQDSTNEDQVDSTGDSPSGFIDLGERWKGDGRAPGATVHE